MSNTPISGNVARQSSPIHYRPDIDGLRAIAVGAVILAHAGVPFVAGGFLGVDVFFVISGFLITSILRRELSEGRYSLVKFYERRARRIIPALIPVLLFCIPLALWLMLPDFRQNFGQSLVATILFSNNLLLAMTSGYWDLESYFKPLLHTWSLGVEEQFYVFFPLLLAGIWRFGSKVQLTTIVLLGAISFAFAEYGWRTDPDSSFYMPHTRAWELMIGCAAAYYARRDRPWDSVLAAVSLAMILVPMFLFDGTTPSPSVYSAIPVLGTVGIILFSREQTSAFRVLSLRPMISLGLISYSAYLWHQPLFAFARIATVDEPTPVAMAGLALLTLVVAWLSWKFVEVPFRKAGERGSRNFVISAVATLLILVGVGLLLHVKKGFPLWTFPNVEQVSDLEIAAYNGRLSDFELAEFPSNGRANVLVVGNSFGRDMGNVLLESGAVADKNLVYLRNYPDCSPVSQEWDPERASELLQDADVVLVALYFEHDLSCAQRIEANLAAQTRATIVLSGPKHYGYNINPFGLVPMEQREKVFADIPDQVVEANAQMKRHYGDLRYIDLISILGPDGHRLRFYDDNGNPLTPDRVHLTRYGALVVASGLAAEQPPAWQAILDVQPHHRSEELVN